MKPTPSARRAVSLSQLLVGSQVALSLLLLIGTGLFVRTLHNLKTVDLGFNPQHVIVISVDPTLIGYKGERIAALYKDLLQRAEATPGVRSATLSSYGLISGREWQNSITVPGYTPRADEPRDANFSPVGPRFFETVGMPTLLGRDFTARDNETAPKVAIVSKSLARHFFGERNPLGQTIGLGVNQNIGQFQIVGVARDAKYGDLHEQPQWVVYFPFLQTPLQLVRRMMLEVSTAADPARMAPALRHAMLSVEKNLPIFNMETLTTQVENSLMAWEMIAALATLFSSVALLLACVGLYGVISYGVVRRTPEIGIRMALGAQTGTILWMVLREVLVLVWAGVTLGIACALAALRLVQGLLYGLKPTDPLTITTATVLLTTVALVASYVPACRAARVDPNHALRCE